MLRVLPRAVLGPFWTAAFTWAGFVFLLFFLFLGADLIMAIPSRLLGPAWSVSLARLEASVVVVTGILLAAWGWVGAHREPDVRHVQVTLDRLPPGASGFTIVQITDLHVSPATVADSVRRIVERVNELNPDLIAITGNLVDGAPDLIGDRVALLGDLRASRGIFHHTGNHEYFSGFQRWLELYRALGFRVLLNERVSIEENGKLFNLAGVPDGSGSSFGNGAAP